MLRPIPFQDLMRLGMKTSFMALEAQSVIAMRLMGMAGMWRVSPSENSRMVTEKTRAATQGAMAATRAALNGQNAAKVANAAISPSARRTKSNVKRLAHKGPGQPT